MNTLDAAFLLKVSEGTGHYLCRRGGYGKKNGVSTLFQIDKGRQIFFMPINYKYNPKHAVLPELCLLEENRTNQ